MNVHVLMKFLCVIITCVISATCKTAADEDPEYAWRRLSVTGDIPSKRCDHTAFEYEGNLFFFGGYNEDSEGIFMDLYRFNVRTNEWTLLQTTGSKPPFRQAHYGALVRDEYVVHGGLGYSNDLYHINMKTLVWKEENPALKPPEAAWGYAVGYENRMIRYGGIPGAAELESGSLWELDIDTWTWTEKAFSCPDGTSFKGISPTSSYFTITTNFSFHQYDHFSREVNHKVYPSHYLPSYLGGLFTNSINSNTVGGSVDYKALWNQMNTLLTGIKSRYDTGSAILVQDYETIAKLLNVSDPLDATQVTDAWTKFDNFTKTRLADAIQAVVEQKAPTPQTPNTTICGDYLCPNEMLACSIPEPVSAPRMVVVNDDMYVLGGYLCSGSLRGGEDCHFLGMRKLNLKTYTWTNISFNKTPGRNMKGKLEPPYNSYGSVALMNGALYYMGGMSLQAGGTQEFLNTMYKFDFELLQWSADVAYGTYPPKVWAPALASMNDQLFYFGGCAASDFFNDIYAYVVDTLDASKSEVSGEGLKNGTVDKGWDLFIESKDAAGKNLDYGMHQVLASGYEYTSNNFFTGDVTDLRNGSYSVILKPQTASNYSVAITINQKHVKGSPYVVEVTAGAPKAQSCTVDNFDDVQRVAPGKEVRFIINSLDQFGNANSSGTHKFIAYFSETKSKGQGSTKTENISTLVSAELIESSQYGILYTFPTTGTYNVSILLRTDSGDQHISGSPFSVNAYFDDSSTLDVYEIVLVAIGGGVAIGVIVFIVICLRKRARKRLINSLPWKINPSELQFYEDEEYSKYQSLGQSGLTLTLRIGHIHEAEYKGGLVLLERYTVNKLEMTHDFVNEMFLLTTHYKHRCILPLIGVQVNEDEILVVNEYMSKGTLLYVLHNKEVALDDRFHFSLMTDVASGLKYLHSRFGAHGHLSSSVLFIGSQWNLKVGGYGLEAIRYAEAPLLSSYREMYCPPELLGDTFAHQGDINLKQSDVFAAGVIFCEILLRGDPWSAADKIREKTTCEAEKESNRGHLYPNLGAHANHPCVEVIHQCLDPDSDSRPAMAVVQKRLVQLDPEGRVSLVEKVAVLLSSYTCDLENLVYQKTQSVVEEKKKTQSLLLSMMPPEVLESLMEGFLTPPRSFDCCTIMFTDIVGHSDLAENWDAQEIVTSLNGIYKRFDTAISDSGLSVHALETFSDIYLVVSGVPRTCGIRHAEQIALLGLKMMEAANEDAKNELLQLRIGFHSGPVVAGLVGITAPKYCLFGDTINVASRMMTSGRALRIHFSEAAKQSLDAVGGFDIQFREEMNIKGKGLMNTYWLLGHFSFKGILADQSKAASLSKHYIK
eukprot:Nk52_evm10s237 gene=Nk52_evmTU10s237